MTDTYDAAGFAEQLTAMDDESLLRELAQVEAAPEAAAPGTLDSVRAEVARRGLNEAQQSDVAMQLREEAAERALEAAYEHAVSLRGRGVSTEKIAGDLKSHGMDAEAASAVAAESAAKAVKVGQDRMYRGGLWLCGGILVTAVTYTTGWLGDSYIVAWGPIAFGAVQFLRGLFRSGPVAPSTADTADPGERPPSD